MPASDVQPVFSYGKTNTSSLTGVRAIAVLLVFAGHLQLRYFPYPELENSIIAYVAYFGMTTFFVLSGFVIHWNYALLFTCKPYGSALRLFFIARVSRLWPLHFAVTLFAILYSANAMDWSRVDLSKFFQHIFMVQSWTYQGEPNNSFYSTWSISTEWFFYFAYAAGFPIFVIALRCNAAVVLSIVIAGGMILAFYVGRNHGVSDMWIRYYAPYLRLSEFLTGVAAAQFVMTRKARHLPLPSDIFFCLVLAITSVGYCTRLWSETNLNYFIAPLVAVLLIVACNRSSILGACLSSRCLLWIGDRSYSIYLFEAIYLVQVVRIETPFGFVYQPSRNSNFFEMLAGSLWAIAGVVIVIAAADLSWRFFEQPSRRWLKDALDALSRPKRAKPIRQ